MNKNKETFKDALRKEFEQKELSEAQLSALRSLGNSNKTPVRLLSSLAAALLLCTSLIIFTGWSQDYQRIAAEIAYNHNSQMQMEVKSDVFDDIQHYLNRLDFSLIASEQLPANIWRIIGGRYCSIDGKIAAQLKVENRENGEVYTLYQAKLPEMLASDKELDSIVVDGVEVKLWKENGLLLGLAK